MSLANDSFRQKIQSRSGSRFGHLSHNMFFAREAAHPRRLRFFPGLNGRPVQMVDDSEVLELQSLQDLHKPRSKFAGSASSSHSNGLGLGFDRTNSGNLPIYAINWTNLTKLNKDTLNTLQFFTGLRNFSFREQQAPKQLTGLAPLVDNWKQELSAFAENVFNEANETRKTPKPPPTRERSETDVDNARKQLYSRKTGRLIESRGNTGRRSAPSRGVHRPALTTDDLPSSLGTEAGVSPQHEYIILQMLGQILQTDDPQAVGVWLASANDREKALALELIRSVISSRSDYFKHDPSLNAAENVKAATAPSRIATSASVSRANELDAVAADGENGLFTIQEESGGKPTADVLNLDEERRLIASLGGKLYGYAGEDGPTLPPVQIPAPLPVPLPVPTPPRKAPTAAKSRTCTPAPNRAIPSACSCPHCGQSVDTWRPATSFLDTKAGAGQSAPASGPVSSADDN